MTYPVYLEKNMVVLQKRDKISFICSTEKAITLALNKLNHTTPTAGEEDMSVLFISRKANCV